MLLCMLRHQVSNYKGTSLGSVADLHCYCWMYGLIGAAFGRFRHIMWTSHRQKLGEMRGKASNVDWAAREGAKEFRRLGKDAAPSLLC